MGKIIEDIDLKKMEFLRSGQKENYGFMVWRMKELSDQRLR